MLRVPGYFGKFPNLGDFVNRRLPVSFVEPWDDWLQEMLGGSKDLLGDQWLDLYLTSPVWNFVLSRPLCSEYPWCGLMMPSVDRVGRYFPLTIACQLPLDCNPVQVASQQDDWFTMADSVILSALNEQGLDLEEFDSQVTALGSLSSNPVGRHTANTGFGTAWQIPKARDESVNNLLPLITHQLLAQRLGEYSLWWATGSEQVAASLLVCSGLPSIEQYSAMLSGDWHQGCWEMWPQAESLEEIEAV